MALASGSHAYHFRPVCMELQLCCVCMCVSGCWEELVSQQRSGRGLAVCLKQRHKGKGSVPDWGTLGLSLSMDTHRTSRSLSGLQEQLDNI